MKKTALARKTPLKNKAPIRRTKTAIGSRKSIRPKSAKRAKQDREVNDLAEFAELFIGRGLSPITGQSTLCWMCRDQWATEIHHAAGRNSPERHRRGNLLALCGRCHAEIIPGLALSCQFVLKRMRDPEGFDPVLADRLIAAKNGGRL